MITKKFRFIGLVIIICNLIFYNGYAQGLQNGLLPLGELSISGSTITQTEGEYSFYFVQNEHKIGEDNSVYDHNFEVSLKINVSDYSNFSIGFHFTTPFDTLIGGSPSLSIGHSNYDIDFTVPSLSDKSTFQYTFNPLEGSVYIGEIRLYLTIATTDEMSQIYGYEKIGIEFTNGTSSSVLFDEFKISQAEYVTTLGPDNVLIPIDFFTIVIALLIYPLLKRSRTSLSIYFSMK